MVLLTGTVVDTDALGISSTMLSKALARCGFTLEEKTDSIAFQDNTLAVARTSKLLNRGTNNMNAIKTTAAAARVRCTVERLILIVIRGMSASLSFFSAVWSLVSKKESNP